MPKKIEMPGRHPSVDVEADIARLFSGLTLPETGISKGWLTDIKILRGVVTNIESNRGYGFGVTSLVARLAGGLRGSAAGTWAVSKQLEELLDTMARVEDNLLSMDQSETFEPYPEALPITVLVN